MTNQARSCTIGDNFPGLCPISWISFIGNWAGEWKIPC